jgi:hypothetical protein
MVSERRFEPGCSRMQVIALLREREVDIPRPKTKQMSKLVLLAFLYDSGPEGETLYHFPIMIYREVYVPYRLENWASAAGNTETANNVFTYITKRRSHRNRFWKERHGENINFTAGSRNRVSQLQLHVTPAYYFSNTIISSNFS